MSVGWKIDVNNVGNAPSVNVMRRLCVPSSKTLAMPLRIIQVFPDANFRCVFRNFRIDIALFLFLRIIESSNLVKPDCELNNSERFWELL